MPQTRKRKVAEKAPEKTDEGNLNKSSVSTRKRGRKRTCPSALEIDIEITALKNNAKQESTVIKSKNSKTGTKKDSRTQYLKPKLKKSKGVLKSPTVKNEAESSQPMDSSDSGIHSETCESLKEEIKSNAFKTERSLCDTLVKRQDESGSSSESEWEEVEEMCDVSLDDYKPNIPKEGVEITLDFPDLNMRKRKKKQFYENEWVRLRINRVRKGIQLSMHKTHLLCLLAHGIYVNQILNSDSLKAVALSLIPDNLLSRALMKKIDKLNESGVEKIVSWFRSSFTCENKKAAFINLFPSLMASFQSQKSANFSEYNLMFVIVARTLGLKVRFCISLYPVTYKATNLIKKPTSKRQASKATTSNEANEYNPSSSSKTNKNTASKQKIKAKKVKSEKRQRRNESKVSRPKRSERKNYKMSSDENEEIDEDYVMEDVNSSDENEEIDEDYVMEDGNSSDDEKNLKKSSRQKRNSTKKSNRKIVSSDSDLGAQLDNPGSDTGSNSIVCWAEIFCKPQKQWIPVECVYNIINKPYNIESLAPQPVCYIIAIDNASCIKDVTRRYCNEFMTSALKLRVDPGWWEETLEPFLPPNSKQNKEEEKKLDELLVQKPLPTTFQGFKNHPLYALKRHLLKFEGIYPPDAPTVGFFRGEPAYARDCVRQLHSKETWLKEARVVRIGEEPYKIVKAQPTWDRIACVIRTDIPLEIFGEWQTEPYEPPVAVDGKVPRNEYRSVELFKPCMLPRGTVYLQLPGLNRIARKLKIDCSPALVGFDGHKRSIRPVFDGFVVCEEFKDVVTAAWDEEQEIIKKREEEMREIRVYGNWKKLIKGLLIRERIKLKYGTK